MTKQELADRIRAASFLEGTFTLRSGRTSNFYVDKYLFETQPEILAEVGKRLAEHVGSDTTRIAGAELGGVALAAATSMACGLPFLIVRNKKKEYGTSKDFEGALVKGDRILLVEDIATTGGQVLEAAKTLTQAGATVERIVAVVDRMEGARDNIESAGFAFDSLLNARDLRLPGAE
ncbi:MAG: orotate phosphoribosyltransferase [Phycisphaerales bacterium]|nr:orotate phosphoribosyltransferase [Phycisphaerales bacterium]MCB9855428.1 orotate phosphoribosyltransferase [Phycisphaerales bacterium]